MSYKFKGPFAKEFTSYISLRESAGEDSRHCFSTYKLLDIFMCENNFSQKILSRELLSSFLDSLDCMPQSKNRRITDLRNLSKYVSAMGIIAYEPDYVKEHTDYIAYTFSDEEFNAIIDAADNFKVSKRITKSTYAFPVVLRVLYGCGLRVNECLNLKWENIDLKTGVIHLKHTKNDKDRDVPMAQSLTELLSSYKLLINGTDDKYLFESDRKPGYPFLDWTFRDWFLKILDEVGISYTRDKKFQHTISPHTLRHYFTYKSFLSSEEKGLSLEEYVPYLSAYLGHRSLLETEKYLTKDYTLYKESQVRVEKKINHLFPEVDFE